MALPQTNGTKTATITHVPISSSTAESMDKSRMSARLVSYQSKSVIKKAVANWTIALLHRSSKFSNSAFTF